MIDDRRCDVNLFLDTPDRPRCPEPGKWYRPGLRAGASNLTFCDQHKHANAEALPEDR